MTAFQEPLEKGWLRTVLNDVREEVNGWAVPASKKEPLQRDSDKSIRQTQAEMDSSRT